MSRSINVVLFDEFTPLDVFGPVEVFSKVPTSFKINFYSENGGTVRGGGNTQVETLPFFALRKSDIFMIPGGWGTRKEINNNRFLEKIAEAATESEYVLTVCTGAALLAKTGLLDGRNATSNKLAFDWVLQQGAKVNWLRAARWVKDGKYYTSSGITAGIDMALGFVEDHFGLFAAKDIAQKMEYTWNREPESDAFGRRAS